jgi:hypothetical protein
MSLCNRRTFMIGIAATCATLGTTPVAAQIDESDPQASALGYKADTTKVDAKKYPNHKNDQTCSNCQLYQGKPTDATAGCTLFAGKKVAGKGWCSAWVKKAA